MSISGFFSLLICQFHSCLLRAMGSHSFIFPVVFNFSLTTVSPVSLSFTLTSSSISSGSSSCKLFTIDFLLVVSTPPLGLGLSTHAGSSILAGCEFGPRVTLPIKVICRMAIWLLMSGMLKSIFLIVLFVIFSSFTCRILIPRILLMLRCRKTSSLLRWLSRSAQDSHPQSSRFTGMARKIRCLARVSAYGLFQKCFRAPIAWLAVLSRLLTS